MAHVDVADFHQWKPNLTSCDNLQSYRFSKSPGIHGRCHFDVQRWALIQKIRKIHSAKSNQTSVFDFTSASYDYKSCI